MPFKDYSTTPASNTEIGDGLFIGPNMSRNDVRPSLQQLAADGRDLYDEVIARTGGTTPSFIQAGTGAVTRLMQGKARDFINLADFLPHDANGDPAYVTDGSVNYRLLVINAINAAITQKKALYHSCGIVNITGRIDIALTGTQELTIIGSGGLNSVFRSTSGGAFRLSGQFFRFNDIGVDVISGGHVFEQIGLVAQSRFLNCYFAQNDPAYSIWENAGYEFVNNRVLFCSLDHITTSTAYAWNLVATGGLINANLFIGNRCDKTGTKHFFNVESTSGVHQFGIKWADNTFEICRGGGIRMRGVRDFKIDFCDNWDAGVGLLINHFYDLDINGSGLGCQGEFSWCSRKDGTFAAGKYDIKLPGSGGGAGIKIAHCIYSAGTFTIDLAGNAVTLEGLSTAYSLLNTAGRGGLDPNDGYYLGGNKVVGTRGAALPADASDLASVIALANAIKSRLKVTGGHGLVAD